MHRAEQQTSVVAGLRAFSVEVGRSRGTGPRATVTTKKSSPFTVGLWKNLSLAMPKVCKTLMSIAACIAEHPKVCRTLMCCGSPRCRWMKGLADLENSGMSVFL